MELGDLRAFVAVSEEGGLRPASRAINSSPAALSRAIGRLERSLEVTLIERQPGHPAKLSPAGVALLAEAKIAFAHLGRGVLMARHSELDNAVVLGLPPLPPVPELHRLVARVEEAFGGLAVTLRRISWRDCFAGLSLASRRVDLAVSIIPGPDARLREVPVEPLTRVAVLPGTHPLAARTRIALADLDSERAVVGAPLSTAAGKFWGLDPRSDGQPRRYARRPKSVSGMLAAIGNGQGFATMPALTSLMWQRSDLAWPVLDVPPAWLGFTSAAATPSHIVKVAEQVASLSVLEGVSQTAAGIPEEPT